MNVAELVATLGLEVDEGAFEKGKELLHRLGTAAGIVAGVATAAGVALYEMAKSTGEAAFQVSKASQKLGVNAQALQELGFAAESTGVSSETLQHGLLLLSRTAFGATENSKELMFEFRRLGLQIYGANGQMKPANELLEDVSDRFSKMPDGIRKTALATKLFGRSGAELIPFLNKGRVGIDALREKASEFGVVLSDEVIADAKEWEHGNHMLAASLQGLKYAIGGPLLKGAGKFKEMLAEIIAKNRKWIASGVLHFVDMLKGGFTRLARIAEPLVELIKALASKIEILAMVAGGLAVAFLGPLALIVAAWLGLALIVEDIYRFLQGEGSVTGDLLNKYLGKETVDKIRKGWMDLKEFWRALFNDDFFAWVNDGPFGHLSEILEEFAKTWHMIVDGIKHDLEVISRFIPSSKNSLFGTVQQLYGATQQTFGGGASPGASVGVSTSIARASVAPSMSANFVINSAGGDPKEIADTVSARMDAFWSRSIRETYAAVAAPSPLLPGVTP